MNGQRVRHRDLSIEEHEPPQPGRMSAIGSIPLHGRRSVLRGGSIRAGATFSGVPTLSTFTTRYNSENDGLTVT